MCGKEATLYRTIIEDTELKLCKECSSFGKVLDQVKISILKKIKQKLMPKREIMQIITPDYAAKIKKAREKLSMKQSDFAKFISEKESILHKLETGVFEPNIKMARKLERILKIKFVEEHEEVYGTTEKKKDESFTIGDVIKIRKR